MSLSLESTKLEHASGPALPGSSGLDTGSSGPGRESQKGRKGDRRGNWERKTQIARVQTESQEGSREGRTGEPGAYVGTEGQSSK